MAEGGISLYRTTLFKISEQLDECEVRKLAYLCKDRIPESQREKISDGLALFDVLEKKGTISEENVNFLMHRLEDIGRRDLIKTLQNIMPNTETPASSETPTRPQDYADSKPQKKDNQSYTVVIKDSPQFYGPIAKDGVHIVYGEQRNIYGKQHNTYASEKPSSPATSPHHPKKAATNIQAIGYPLAAQQSQIHKRQSGLKTPADFSPKLSQARDEGAPSDSPKDAFAGLRGVKESGRESGERKSKGPTLKGASKRIDSSILDWPNTMTPLQAETPEGNDCSLIKPVYNSDGTPRMEVPQVASGKQVTDQVCNLNLSTPESKGQGGDVLSFDDMEDNVEVDAPQAPQLPKGDDSVASAQDENLMSFLPTLTTFLRGMEINSQGSQVSETTHDKSDSTECNRAGIGDAVSAVDTSGQIQLRDYQHELAHCPLSTGGNYIICAPTGSGKTLTAAHICYTKYTRFQASSTPGGYFKALFIVHIRHLKQQQRDAFQAYFPSGQAVMTIGDQQTFEYALRKDEPMPVVLMLTAQIVVNALKTKSVALQDLNMLIIDECHHTDLLHPYNAIMKQYLKQKASVSQGAGEHRCLPQVIGLSASLGVGHGRDALAHVLKLCANMDVRDVLRVRKYKVQLDQYVKTPEQDDIIAVPCRVSTERHFGTLVEDIMFEIEGQLEKIAQMSLPRRGCQPYENKVTGCQETSPSHMDIISYMYLNAYNRALMLYEDLPIETCLQTLKSFHASRSLCQSQEDSSREKHCHQLFDDNLEEMEKMATQEGDNGNQKLQILVKHLADQFSENPGSKGIVLTRMKVATVALCEFIRSSTVLKQLGCPVKPERLVGQGPLEDQCMTESAQRRVLDSFRDEEGCNILVATDIAQEGLDMPACNFVIRYNFVSNEIGTVQSKGRARAKGSKCYLIVESGSTNEMRELENRDKVKWMEEALNQLEAMTEDQRWASIKAKQEEVLAAMLAAEQKQQRQVNMMRTEGVDLRCAECKAFICKAADLRRKGLGGYVTCVDPSFMERVHAEDLEREAVRYRDTQAVCKIMCGPSASTPCKNQLGTKEDFFLDEDTVGFSLRKTSFICQFASGGMKNLTKWKQVISAEDVLQ